MIIESPAFSEIMSREGSSLRLRINTNVRFTSSYFMIE